MSWGQIALESRNEWVGGENGHTTTHILLLNPLGQHRFSPQRLNFGLRRAESSSFLLLLLSVSDDTSLLSSQSDQWEETSDTHTHDKVNDGHVGLMRVCVSPSMTLGSRPITQQEDKEWFSVETDQCPWATFTLSPGDGRVFCQQTKYTSRHTQTHTYIYI